MYDVVVSQLQSRYQRLRFGVSGVRRIEAPLEGGGGLSGGNFFQRIANFVGWVTSGISSLFRFTASGVWGGMVQTTTFLWHFNWNASDSQLDAQLSGFRTQLAGYLGGTLGNLAGYYVCGILPASKMMVFNEALGARILEEVSEEAFDEFSQNLSLICQSAFNMATMALITNAYKNTRRVIKGIFENPDSPQSQALQGIFGDGINDAIASWGEGNKPWTFAGAVDEKIESISDTSLQNFTEEFLEEAFDACVEAGYIVANGIDAWYAEQRLQREIVLGPQEGVEIYPNRESEERIVLAGREEILRPVITQVMAGNTLIENRDIGMFIGEPVREHLRRSPSKFSLKIVWARHPSPPWYRGGDTKALPAIEIPNVKRSKLDWETIKLAAGGENGRMWGRFWASAQLIDALGNTMRSPRIYAGSEEQAIDDLQLLLTLSNFDISTMGQGEEQRMGLKAPGQPRYKETTRIYPAYCTILHAEKILSENGTLSEASGTYKRQRFKLPLWTSTKPSDWDDVIAELLSTPGTDGGTP